MSRVGRAAMLLCLGGLMTQLLWTGQFGSFVQQHMRLPLVGAAVVLLVFGVYEAISGSTEEHRDPSSARRRVGPSVGWLMILPVVVIISVAPSALGSAAADRVEAFTPNETQSPFDPLPESDGPIEMRVVDFLDRALWDDERSLASVPVRLEGLVVNDPSVPDGFKLTRFMVSCCAADGIPLQVTLRGIDSPLPNDTWVVADIVWREPELPYGSETGNFEVEADAVTITVVPDAPNDPYESPY